MLQTYYLNTASVVTSKALAKANTHLPNGIPSLIPPSPVYKCMHRMNCQPGGHRGLLFQWIHQSGMWQGKNSSTCRSPGEMLHIPSACSEQEFHCRITWNKTHIKSVLETRSRPAPITFSGNTGQTAPISCLALSQSFRLGKLHVWVFWRWTGLLTEQRTGLAVSK